jgi:hypothetical protein
MRVRDERHEDAHISRGSSWRSAKASRHAPAMQSGHAFIRSAGKTFGSHCASNHPDSAQKISMVDCHMKSSVRFFVSMPISSASPAR